MARAVQQHVVTKPQHPLVSELTVRLDRMWSRGLVKGQPKVPFAVMSVGEIAVAQVERCTAAEEMRIDEHEVETATVRIAAVQQRQLRGRAEKIALGEADVAGVVATRAREARLRLRAPPIRGNGPDRELPVR